MNKGIYTPVIAAVLCLLLSQAQISYAQDATWFKDVTSQVGLDSARSGQISACDVNGDGYPDLLLLNLAYDRSMKTRLWLNKQNPDSSNPRARIFVDVTNQSNMYENRDTSIQGRIADCWGIADLNNDGFPDLVSGLFYFNVSTFKDLGDRMEVLLNDGTGRFSLVRNADFSTVGDQASIPPGKFPATSFCFLDYDLDGILDIYVGTFSANHQSDIWLPGYLFKGRGDGTFINVTDESGISAVFEPTYGASVTDWNNDGYPDIITSPYCRTEGTLWRNEGDGTFTNVSIETGYSSKNGMHGNIDVGGSPGNWIWFPRELCQWEALPADFDNDGDMDVAQMLIHGGLDPQEGRSTLTMNDGPASNYTLKWNINAFDRPLNNSTIIRRDTVRSDTTWSNQYGSFYLPRGSIVTTSNYGHLGDQAGSWIDLDGDGLQDFLLSTTGYDPTNDRCYIQRQNPDHSFTDISLKLGLRSILKETHSQRPFDYDLDGDDDFLIEYAPRTANPQSGRVWLMRNDVANTNNHTTVHLVAPDGCNRSCIGCRVWVYSGGVRQMRDIQSGIGRWGMAAPLSLNFGLARNTSIDSIVVRWAKKGFPTTTVVNPPINTPLRISMSGVSLSADNDINDVDQLGVAPNPVLDRLTLHVPRQYRSRSTLSIYDVRGEKLLQQPTEGQEYVALSVGLLPQGLYFVRIDGELGYCSTSFVKVD